MTLIDENKAEQATLDWFEELGYERVTDGMTINTVKGMAYG